MYKISLKLFTIFGLSLFLGLFLFSYAALAAPELIKSVDFDTIYYLDDHGVRHPFPNLSTYQSWYGDDFSKVIALSSEVLAQYSLGSNITVRPGTKIVKVRSAPQVYAVEQGGVLREIQNENIAAAIYGENWAGRVVDVPEVFFGDYNIGAPIKHDYTIPDSILFQDQESGIYYFRNNGILQEFTTTAAVLANNFNLADAFVSSRGHFIRNRPIIGFDKNVFNPVASSLADRRDCQVRDLKAAFIFLAEEAYKQDEVEKVQTIKSNVSNYYSWVSNELSAIDVNYPTSIMIDDGYLLKARNDNTLEIRNEVISTFYDTNQDIFDFIFIFTNFDIPSEDPSRVAYSVPITNKVEGIGKAILNRANLYGSKGKLKSIIMMGNVDQYSPGTTEGLDRALDIVVHEILHQWGVYITFDDNGIGSSALLRDDKAHWSTYLQFISPLGGSGWIDNGNGNYTSGLLNININKRQYTDLDLYLMGVLPKQVIDPVTLFVPDIPNKIGNTIQATPKEITIDQIIRGSGEHRCSWD